MINREESSKVELHWALFDSAFHTPSGSHWTWHSEALDAECLDALYYEVLVDEISSAASENPATVIRQGFASIDHQWCCWFRLFDGGRDNRGRPGRYLIAAAFAKRPLRQACDSQQVFSLMGFAAIEAIREEAAPLPTPKSFVTSFLPLPFGVSGDALANVPNGKSVLQVGKARALASLCAASEEISSWNCIELANDQSAKLRVVRVPQPELLEQPIDPVNTASQHDLDCEAEAKPLVPDHAPPGKRRWGIWALCMLGVISIVVIALLVVQRRLQSRIGGDAAVQSPQATLPELKEPAAKPSDAKQPDVKQLETQAAGAEQPETKQVKPNQLERERPLPGSRRSRGNNVRSEVGQ